MTDGPGQTIDHRLLILVDMAVRMGDAVGVHIGVIVFMLVVMFVIMVMIVVVVMMFHTCPSFCIFCYYTAFFRSAQAPKGDVPGKINALTLGLFFSII